MSGDVIGIEIDLHIAAGRGLVAKDGGGFLGMGKAKTSDPYVAVKFGGRVHAKTNHVQKTLDPVWDATFKIHLDKGARGNWRPNAALVLAIYDYDKLSENDPMGEVTIPATMLQGGHVTEKWFPVQNCPGCKNASGELRVKLSVLTRHALSLKARQSVPIPRTTGTLAVGLGWDMLAGNQAIDLDASCVAVDFKGRVLKEECVYFAQLESHSKAIRHTGDEREGDEDLGEGDDEIIVMDLRRIPANICALHFIASVASEGRSFADVKSAKMRLFDWDTGKEECRFIPAMAGAHTSIFFARLARSSPRDSWTLTSIGDADHTARDWGTLIPEVMMYTQDLVPGLRVDLNARVAIMRKGGLVRLADYCAERMPASLVCGLYWDVTDGVNIDLDASVVMLDATLNVLDTVFFGKLRSSDGSIQHGGDEREGDEKGDDEKIFINLAATHPAVHHIFIVINSYSGQELDDVKDAGCHLFDGRTMRDIARFEMTNTAFLDKHTALLVGDIFRDTASGDWAFDIASVAAKGRTANLNVPSIVGHLKSKPSRALPPPRRPPGGGTFRMRNLGEALPAAAGLFPNALPTANGTAAQPEDALSDTEFCTRLGCSRAEFAAMQPWKQRNLRQLAGLAPAAPGPPVPIIHGDVVQIGQAPPPPMGQVVCDPSMGHMAMGAPPTTFVAQPAQPSPAMPIAAPTVDNSGSQTPPAVGGGGGEGSTLAALQELKSMFDMGLLTQGEFDAKKGELLKRM